MRAPRRALLSIGVSAILLAVPAGAPLTSAVVHAPRIVVPVEKTPHPGAGHGGGGGPAFGWASSNWSGYALSGGPYTSVTGTWIVPAVAPSRRSTYSSSWVGIDGFSDSSLIQTGTEQDFVNGAARYYAWWEILPAPETVITTVAVAPGDVMRASIAAASTGSWTITITDVTRNESFTTTQSYNGPLSSAEWIEEAPTVGGSVATLANYGQTTFDPGTANGADPRLVTADGGVMIQHGAQVSTPSVPDSDSDGFNVAYGSTSPPAPSS